MYHAKASLQCCLDNGIGSFDLVFAYEAMARAYSVSKNTEEMKRYLALGREAAAAIEDEGEKKYFLGELGNITG